MSHFIKTAISYQSKNKMGLPFAIEDLPFWSQSGRKPIASWGRRGALAVAVDEFLTLYIEKEGKLEIFSSKNLFYSPITTLAWSDGFDKTGYLPAYVFVSSESGENVIYDVKRSMTISSLKHERGVKTIAVAASPVNPLVFFVSTNKDQIIKMDFSELATPVASAGITLPHSINTISINPFDFTKLICSSKEGHFTEINNILSPPEDQQLGVTQKLSFLDEDDTIVSCSFYPFLANTLCFVSTYSVYIYTLTDNIFSLIYKSDSRSEPLYGVSFTEYDPRLVILLHRSHVKLGCVDKLSLDTYQSIRAPLDLSKLECKPKVPARKKSIDSMSIVCESAIAVRGKEIAFIANGSVMLIEIKNQKLEVKSIMKQLYGMPTDIKVFENMAAITTSSGQLGIITNLNGTGKSKVGSVMFQKLFYIHHGPLNSCHFLSPQKIIVSGTTENNRQKVYMLYPKTGVIKSLLKTGQEMFGTCPPKIIISPRKTFFAASISDTVVVIFNEKGEQVDTLIEPDSRDFVFGGIVDEFWVFLANGLTKRYSLKSKSATLIHQFNLKLDKAQVTSALATTNYFIVGTSNGFFYHFSWDGDLQIFCQVSTKPIVLIKTLNETALVMDESGVVFRVDTFDTMVSRRLTNGIEFFEWITPDYAYAKFINNDAISTVHASDLTEKFGSIPTHLLGEPVIESLFSRNDKYQKLLLEVKTPQEMVRVNEEFGYCVFADIYKALVGKLTQVSLNFITQQESALEMFSITSALFLRSKDEENATTRRIRLDLLRGEQSAAFDTLMMSTPGTQFFQTNILKAALIGLQPQQTSAVVAALVGNGSVNTAIDLLMITQQWGHASRILTSVGDYETALYIAMSVADEKDFNEIVKAVAKDLLNQGNNIHAAALYMIAGEAKEAAAATKDLFELPLLPDNSLLKTSRPKTPKLVLNTNVIPLIPPKAGTPTAQPITTTTTVVTKRIIKRKIKKPKAGEEAAKEEEKP